MATIIIQVLPDGTILNKAFGLKSIPVLPPRDLTKEGFGYFHITQPIGDNSPPPTVEAVRELITSTWFQEANRLLTIELDKDAAKPLYTHKDGSLRKESPPEWN